MTAHASDSQTRTEQLAAEAFIYGFPLVFDLQEVERFTRVGLGALAPAPLNVFSHATTLAGPQDTFVSINNDTIYSIAHSTPAAARCAWTSLTPTAATTCCSSSTPGRTTSPTSADARQGPTPARSCWCRPAGTERAPDGATVIRLPTAVASIVGRWAVDGEDDLPAVRALQAAADADGERRRRRAPRARPARARGPRVLRAHARVDAGVPAGGARPRVPASASSRSACSPRTRRTPATDSEFDGGAAHGPGSGARAPGAGDQARFQPAPERLEPDLPRLRLQPRLLRGGRARRAAVEAPRRPAPAT